MYHAFYYIPLTSTSKGSVLHNTRAWFPLVALELFTGYTTKCPSSETQGQLVGKRSLSSYSNFWPRTFYRPDKLPLGLRGYKMSCRRESHRGEFIRSLYRSENFTSVRNFATVPCKREMTTLFAMKMVCRWTETGSAWVVLVNSFMLVTERRKTCKNINTIRNQEVVPVWN